ncbi:ATP-dependent zinc metalloprotease FtsH [Lujinxingia litoralis]|nr:ATP-dependent zinc metalloprotease FtsH [Lujinxingia litoralis]
MDESPHKGPGPESTPDPLSAGFTWRTVLVALAVGLGALLIFYQVQGPGAVSQIPYSEFKGRVTRGEVSRVVLSEGQLVALPTDEALARERDVREDEGFERWQAHRPAEDQELLPLLEAAQVVVEVAPRSGCGEGGYLWIWVLAAVMIFVFWSFMIRRMQMLNAPGPGNNSPVMSFGKSRARVYAEEGTGVTFDDVAGVEEAKEELREIISFLREPSRFTRLGGKVPKGVLLVGPPGTGKTLLARAVAGEAEVPFFNLSGSDFVEMFVGVGAARVRDLFQQAQESAPCIIFVDELDAIGKARGAAGYQSNEEREQTLNALLVEMDGFDPRSGVIIIAATNRPEVLDPALLRSGRFDRQVVVDRPDKKGRRRILEVHARKVVMDPEVDLDVVAAQTPGFVGADLANIVNEAALLAARKNKSQVELEDFQASIERVMAGLERKSRRLSEKESRIVAYHEAGHAIVAGAMADADPVHKISIVSRGIGALGYTLQVPLEDRYLVTRSELHDRICMLLGGRAAEHIVFGDVSSGAANDLQRVTDIARRMVSEYGMGQAIGNLSYGEDSSPFLKQMGVGARGYSDQTAQKIDAEVQRIVENLYGRTLDVLNKNVDLLHEMADTLQEQEVLEGADLNALMERVHPAEAVSGLGEGANGRASAP